MRRLIGLILLLAATGAGQAQPVPEGVVFDDFDYTSAAWVPDPGTSRHTNPGSLFGWNVWHRSLTPADTVRDRLWYQGYSWIEFDVPSDRFAMTTAVDGQSTVSLRAPAGAAAPAEGEAQAEIASGFLAREGTWAARVRFSSLSDVLALAQTFWAMTMYGAVLEQPDGTRRKGWSEVDHEFNNWIHTLWERDPRGGATMAEQYTSDEGGDYDGTGYFEGEHVYPVTMAGEGQAPYHCTLQRNNDAPYRLSPATCASVLRGDAPRLIYGRPAVVEPVATNLLISASLTQGARFAVRAAWTAPGFNGTETDRYMLAMASDPDAGHPGPSQPMAARFSHYVWDQVHGADLSDRTLLRDHALQADWFYYATDPTLSLPAVASQVDRFRAAGVARLNTLGRGLHRPYKADPSDPVWPHWRAEHAPAVYVVAAPARVAPGAEGAFVGTYAHRVGDLRLAWSVEHRSGEGDSRGWQLVRDDAWFRQAVPFPFRRGPDGWPVQTVRVRLQVGEYPGDAFQTRWATRPAPLAERVLTYHWDARTRHYVCVDCAAAQEPAE